MISTDSDIGWGSGGSTSTAGGGGGRGTIGREFDLAGGLAGAPVFEGDCAADLGGLTIAALG